MKILKGKIIIKRKKKDEERDRERRERNGVRWVFMVEQWFSCFMHINQLSLTFYGSVINHSIYGFHV